MVEERLHSLQSLLLGTFPYTHWSHTHNHSPSWLPQSQSGPRTTLTPWKIPLRMIRGRFCLGAKLTLRREYKETAEQTAHSTAVEKRGREMCNVVHVLAKND